MEHPSPKFAKAVLALFLFSLGFSGSLLNVPRAPDVAVAFHDGEDGEVGDTECSDHEDNDGDGDIDLADEDCDDTDDSSETNECEDEVDNDGDGAIDEDDFSCDDGCDNESDCTAECQNGEDDDDDDATDYPDDFSCSSNQDDDEEEPPSACQDGEDNDDDGNTDGEDAGCNNEEGEYDSQDNDESKRDFGDAPDASEEDEGEDGEDGGLEYPTLLSNEGAYHEIVEGIQLGSAIDAESDGQPSDGADGDDTDGDGDDEDGVTFTTPLVACEEATVEITGEGEGYLDLWIDFDQDGEWEDGEDEGSEHVLDDEELELSLEDDPETFEIDVPCDATTGDTYARARFSSEGDHDPEGSAEDGEVEDYRVTIEELDFGDAPDVDDGEGEDGVPFTYPTLRSSDGARHVIVEGLHLGELIDAESDGQPTIGADGDDSAGEGEGEGEGEGDGGGVDDEDGVTFPEPLTRCQTSTLEFRGVGSGFLDGWIDFDRDGEFDDVEHVIDTGAIVLSLVTATPIGASIPCEAELGSTYARFRWSTTEDEDEDEEGEGEGEGDGGLGPDGLASDGEVEDYLLSIEAACSDGVDNDEDGWSDEEDISCYSDEGIYNPEQDDEANPKTACQDGVDNDEDALVDFGPDPGCSSTQDKTEIEGSPACHDASDNDGDGAVDYPFDGGCSSLEDDAEEGEGTSGEGGGGGSGGGGGGGGSRAVGAALGASASPGVAPGAFGGVENPLTKLLCKFQGSFSHSSDEAIALVFSQFFGLPFEDVLDAIEDPDTCSSYNARRASLVVSGPKPLFIDQSGVPVTAHPVFNACIRHTIVLRPDGHPYSCGRYVNKNRKWEIPDSSGLSVTWNHRLLQNGFSVPWGYELVTFKKVQALFAEIRRPQ